MDTTCQLLIHVDNDMRFLKKLYFTLQYIHADSHVFSHNVDRFYASMYSEPLQGSLCVWAQPMRDDLTT